MTVDELIQAKLYRLEELRKYQSYYGPNTPYPVILEINDLETELRRLLQTKAARSAQKAKKKTKKKSTPLWPMSQATFDAVVTIAFIGFVFLLGSIIFAAYVQTRPAHSEAALAYTDPGESLIPTLRPTFTPTPGPGTPIVVGGGGEITVIENPYLPLPGQAPTDIPTIVPTLTPSAVPSPTPTSSPTETAVPADTPPPPPPPQQSLPTAVPAASVPTPAASNPPEPTPAPQPAHAFSVGEQGNREFQHTNYHVITIYVAVVSEGNIPIGGLKIVGDHVPSGAHTESGPSDWNWSVVNCLDCDYVKQGNVKFEPGTFTDGIWNIYVADQSGAPLSSVVSLTYSADPNQWVWDFIVFRKNG